MILMLGASEGRAWHRLVVCAAMVWALSGGAAAEDNPRDPYEASTFYVCGQ